MTLRCRALLTVALGWPAAAHAGPGTSPPTVSAAVEHGPGPEASAEVLAVVAELEHAADRLYDAGDLAGAHAELARAYASLRDPRHYLIERDNLLGSMRSVLLELYDKTGELRHLCRARADQLLHLEALLVAFGEDTDLSDVPGTRRRLRQIAEKMAQHRPRLDEPACDGVMVTIPRQVPPVRAAPPPPRARPRLALVAGATSVSLGGVLLGAMTYALVVQRSSIANIEALAAAAATQPGGRATRAQRERERELLAVGRHHHTAAIITGVMGGALAVAGVVTLVLRPVLRDRPRRLSLYPLPNPTGGALLLTGHF